MPLARIKMHLSGLVIALMAWACIASPMSAVADIAIACDDIHQISADSYVSEEAPSQDTSQEGSGHQFHHCGSCHNHIIGEDGGDKLIAASVSLLSPVPDQTMVLQTSPDGPYRPPRA
jgi:hypothetical protein